MEPPHRDGNRLELTTIESYCCMSVIAALNSAILLLLQCDVELLAMLKAENPLQMVSRISLSLSSVALLV